MANYSYLNTLGSGNRTGTITVTTTATLGAGAIGNLVNGSLLANSSNATWFNGGQSGREVKFDLGSAKIVKQARWYQDSTATHGTWKWQGSNDNSIWTDIGGTFTLGGVNGAQIHVTLISNATAYRYYKLLQTSGTTSSSPWLREIEFYIDGATHEQPDTSYEYTGGTGDRTAQITVTTTATLALGIISNLVDGVQDANNATDAIGFTNGESGREIVFDFTPIGKQRITEFEWRQSNSTTHGTWKIQGWNGASYVDIATGIVIPGGSSVLVAPFTNTAVYLKYKLLQTSGTTSSSPWVTEVKFNLVSEVTAVTNAGQASRPTISGTAQEGETLTAMFNDDDPDGAATGIAYQWKRDGATIGGATATTYTLVDADVGRRITITVSYTDPLSFSESVTSVPTDSVLAVDDGPASNPTISGVAQEGQTVTAVFADDDPDGAHVGALIYQWKRDGIAISGATSATYDIESVDVGHRLSVSIVYVDGQGFTHGFASAETYVVADESAENIGPASKPIITGTTQEYHTLTATFADDDPEGAASEIEYQWKRDGVVIAGADDSTYLLTPADVGHTITVAIGYLDGEGFAELVTSDPTAVIAAIDSGDASVSITGTAQEGQILTADFNDDDPDGSASEVAYQWKRDGVAISGATGVTYVPQWADIGHVLSVTVSYVDAQSFAESVTSANTASVIASVRPPIQVCVVCIGK